MPKPDWVYDRRERLGKQESKKKWKKRIAQHERERIEYGFSVYDWWSFDTYIAEVIALGARRFRKDGVGYPASYDDDPKEALDSWNKILKGVEKPLMAYAQDKFETFDIERSALLHKGAETALKLFAKNLGSFWD